MAAITPLNATQLGAFAAEPITLTASDTITFSPSKKQLLILRNITAGALTVTIDGAAGTTVNFPGAPGISVAAGYAVALPAGQTKAVILSTISAYLQGVVTLTGGAGVVVQQFDI